VSRDGQQHHGAVIVATFPMPAGLVFDWHTHDDHQAALPALAAGEPVSAVARRAGYDTVSAFVAAFRRETGSTPAAYFAASTVSR
jgi:AraC-like DNA-binding protein